MTMTLRASKHEYEYIVDRPDGGRITATRAVSETVVHVDHSDAAPVPAGAKLLSAFLDEFEALPEIAEGLAEARREFAREGVVEGRETLRDLRLAKGLSQKEFAHAVGTSQSRVSRLEARLERPSEDTLRAMAGALAVDFNTLMDALSRADR